VEEVEFSFNPKKGIRLSGNEMRKILGYSNIRSTNFKIVPEGNYLKFIGSGSGHGVGMCQWGAKGMADKGYKYRQILQHFYRGVKIKRLY
jgi:stage II sporulation protein D